MKESFNKFIQIPVLCLVLSTNFTLAPKKLVEMHLNRFYNGHDGIVLNWKGVIGNELLYFLIAFLGFYEAVK